jgi:hypothetical protein
MTVAGIILVAAVILVHAGSGQVHLFSITSKQLKS